MSSIVCGCDWCVRFKGVNWRKCTNSDPVIITDVCGVHTNTCDPSFVDQFVLTQIRSGDYNKCDDQH